MVEWVISLKIQQKKKQIIIKKVKYKIQKYNKKCLNNTLLCVLLSKNEKIIARRLQARHLILPAMCACNKGCQNLPLFNISVFLYFILSSQIFRHLANWNFFCFFFQIIYEKYLLRILCAGNTKNALKIYNLHKKLRHC